MSDTQQFLTNFAPYAQAEQARSGIPASITLAQAAEESGWGGSELASKFYNFFGIKTSKGWNGTTQYYPTKEQTDSGDWITVVAGFRAYDSAAASFADHSDFILGNDRYAAIKGERDPYKVADDLQAAGYATDKGYADKLKNIIKDFDLTQYDAGGTTPVSDSTTHEPVATKTTPEVKTAGFSLMPKWISDFNPADFFKRLEKNTILYLVVILVVVSIAFFTYQLASTKGGD